MSNQTDERRGGTSASNAQADSLCPGRHLAQRGLPETSNGDASYGTRIHAALSTQDPSNLTLEERETYDACLAIEAEQVKKFFGAEFAKDVKTIRENGGETRRWVKVPAVAGGPIVFEHSCQCDVVHRTVQRALIVEYKTLAGDVPVSSKNLQLRDQQCLVRGSLLIQGDIGVVVVQPFVTRNPDICVYTAEDTMQATLEMFDRIRASNNPKSLRVAGEDQCKYCRAKFHCLEYQQWASAMVPALARLEVPAAQWTAEQRSIFLSRAPIAEKWLEETKAAIKAGLLQDPNFAPGFTLKAGNTIETVKDPQECFNRFLGLGGKPEQFMQAVKVGKTALKEAVHVATDKKGKALDKVIEDMLQGITERKQNSPSIVKVGDK